MQAPLVTQENYLETLLLYHEEEIMGEAYFNALADRFNDPEARRKLRLLAQVERRAAESVRPLLEKYGLAPRSDEELKTLGLKGVERDADTSWPDFVAYMAVDYRKYMPYFLALEGAAPPEDLPALKMLTEHETISIDFAERESRGLPGTAAILESYIRGERPIVTT